MQEGVVSRYNPQFGIFPRIDDSHCDRIHSSLTADHRLDEGYKRKEPATLTEYCAHHTVGKEHPETSGVLTAAI